MLSRDAFVRHIGRALSIDAATLESGTFASIGLDSIERYQIDVLVEELGVLLPEDLLVSMQCIDDVYRGYIAELVEHDLARDAGTELR